MKRFCQMLDEKEKHSRPENQINSKEKELNGDNGKENECEEIFSGHV
jgi:hypothetical protein